MKKTPLTSLFVVVLALLVFVGCSGSREPVSASSTPEPDAAPVTVRIRYTYFNKDPLMRFAAEFSNPGAKPRAGVTATWKALDKEGAIVGTYSSEIAPIPAGETILYVGGAGAVHLSGTPAQVKVEVSDEGREIEVVPRPGATVSKFTIKKSGFSLTPGTTDYEVSTVVTAETDLASSDLDLAMALRDSSGKFVGAGWGDFSTLPEKLQAGEKARVTTRITVPKGKPKTVESNIWVR